MTDDYSSVRFGDCIISYVVKRRARKSLAITVEPDTSVVVIAPICSSKEEIANTVRKRANWVLRQQRYFSKYLPRTPERQFVSGETHLYLGRQYRLKVVAADNEKITLTPGFITVYSHQPNETSCTRRLVEHWYINQAREVFTERLQFNLKRFPDPVKFCPKELLVRKLKLRWGSLSPSNRLLLNRRLIEAPINAIDYVITHELCHIVEPNHSPTFYNLLERVLPDWQIRKEGLERIMF